MTSLGEGPSHFKLMILGPFYHQFIKPLACFSNLSTSFSNVVPLMTVLLFPDFL